MGIATLNPEKDPINGTDLLIMLTYNLSTTMEKRCIEKVREVAPHLSPTLDTMNFIGFDERLADGSMWAIQIATRMSEMNGAFMAAVDDVVKRETVALIEVLKEKQRQKQGK